MAKIHFFADKKKEKMHFFFNILTHCEVVVVAVGIGQASAELWINDLSWDCILRPEDLKD